MLWKLLCAYARRHFRHGNREQLGVDNGRCRPASKPNSASISDANGQPPEIDSRRDRSLTLDDQTEAAADKAG